MKHLFYASFLFLTTLTFLSCDTEVPEEDETKPGYVFTVFIKDGETKTFKEDTPNASLNVPSDAEHTFWYRPFDKGGVEYAKIKLPKNNPAINITFEDGALDNWAIASQTSNYITYKWTGDKNTPKDGTILVGNITLFTNETEAPIDLEVGDFGGQGGNNNEDLKNIQTGTITLIATSEASKSGTITYHK